MRPPVSRGLTKWPRTSTIMNKSNVYNCHHHQQVSFSMSSLNCWAVWIHTKSRHRVGAISIRQALLSSCWSGWVQTLDFRVIHRINNRRGYAHRNAMIHIISFFQRLSLPHASMSWVEIERIIMQNGFLSIYVCCTMRWSISVSRRVSRKCTCLCQCNKKKWFFSCCCTEATVCFDIVD